MRIVHPQLGQFLQAIETSFDPDGLEDVLLRKLGLHYRAVANRQASWKRQVMDVHGYFDMRNTTEALVTALRDQRPEVVEFAVIAAAMAEESTSRNPPLSTDSASQCCT